MIHYLLNNRIIELAIYAQDKPTTDRILIFFYIYSELIFIGVLMAVFIKLLGMRLTDISF